MSVHTPNLQGPAAGPAGQQPSSNVQIPHEEKGHRRRRSHSDPTFQFASGPLPSNAFTSFFAAELPATIEETSDIAIGSSSPSFPSDKAFALPSIASFASNISTSYERPRHSLPVPAVASTKRRLSPLGVVDSADTHSSDEEESAALAALASTGRRRSLGVTISSSGTRPRSHSTLSLQSAASSGCDGEGGMESGSESGGDEKRLAIGTAGGMTGIPKKRSRTLTTPTQQRRLTQILEQTRFPSTELREQLARELGMTPRRVQIWFQNRRQGMKKAREMRAEAEANATPSSAMDYNNRGYSFGSYPAPPPDANSGYNPYTSMTYQGTPPYAPVETHGPQLYSARSMAPRGGMARQLPHLQLSSNTSLETLPETAGSFAWSSESRGGSWNNSAGFSLTPASSAVNSMPHTGDNSPYIYSSSKASDSFDTSAEYTNYGPSVSERQTGRQRSHTNPEPFVPFNNSNYAMAHPMPTDLHHPSLQRVMNESGNGGHYEPRGRSNTVWTDELARLRLEENVMAGSSAPLNSTSTSPAVASGPVFPPGNAYAVSSGYIAPSTEATTAAAGLMDLAGSAQPTYDYPISSSQPQGLAGPQNPSQTPPRPLGHYRQRSRSLSSFNT